MTADRVFALGIAGEDACLRLVLSLLHFLWQGSAIAASAAIGAWLLRRRSPSSRYLLYSVALFSLPVCLVVTFAVAAPRRCHDVAHTASRQTATALATPSAPVARGVSRRAAEDIGDGSEDRGMAAPVTSIRSDGVVDASAAKRLPARIAPIVAAAYLAGACAMLLRLALAIRGGNRLRAGSVGLNDAELLEQIARQCQRLGLTFVPFVACCERVNMPTVIGVLRPVLLLPASMITGLAPEQVAAIVDHELAHIRRNDLLMNLVQRVIESLLFFHPAVWYVSRKMSAEREICCDDLAVSAGHAPLQYAGALLRMAELYAVRRTGAMELAAAGNPTQFESRIRRLINAGQRSRLRLTRAGVVMFALLVGSAMIAPALLHSLVRADETTAIATPREVTRNEEAEDESDARPGPSDGASDVVADLQNGTGEAGLLHDPAVSELLGRAAGQRRGLFGGSVPYVTDNVGHIVELRLKGAALRDGDMAIVGRLRHLTRLQLSDSNVEGRQLAHLQGLEDLRELELFQTEVGDTALAQLQSLPALERLNVGRTRVSDEGLPLLRALTGLRHLDLTDCRITDAGVRHLAELENLETLKLGGTEITDGAIPTMRRLKKLRGLTLNETKTTRQGLKLLSELRQFTWIRSPLETMVELARRMEAGDFDAVSAMEAVGLNMPQSGQFTLTEIEPLPQTARDEKLDRHRFRLEMRWRHGPDRIDDRFFAVVAVIGGAVRHLEMGVEPYTSEPAGKSERDPSPAEAATTAPN